MEKTTNYNLNKPSQDDFYNVDDFNTNADIVDAELKANADAIASKTKRVKDITIPIASWTADLTFPDFPFKAEILVEGITEDWNCISLTPDHTDRALDMLCPFAYTSDGSITIWIDAVPDHDVIIESIIFTKAVI